MGSQEIVASNSSSCMIEVGHGVTMKEDDIPDVGDALIFRMSRSLPDADRLYSPRFVSIGPFHYGKDELKGMEKSKNEAVRRMQIRIQKKDPEASIKSFVERDLLPKDKEIRKFYGEHIPFTPTELAWIVARDACFIFEFFLNYTSWGVNASLFYKNEQKGFSWKYDPVFDVVLQNPMREGLMNDMLLFENQIPLWVLKDILQIQMGSPEAAGQKLDELADMVLGTLPRHRIFWWYIPPSHEQCSHVLEMLYSGLVGHNINGYENWEAYQFPPSRNRMQVYFKKCVDSMKAFCRQPVCKRWCKLNLRSPSSNTSPGNAQQTPSSSHNCMQIYFKKGVDSTKVVCGRLCKFASSNTSHGNVQLTPSSHCNYIQIWFKSGVASLKTMSERLRKMCLGLLSSNTSPDRTVHLDFVKLPTAFDLTRAGVKIHPVTFANRPEKRGSGIRWVRFDEKEGMLYLPEILVTQQLYSVMSNIIAMELSTSKYHPRPMTQYVLFMDELMDSEEDVAVLRKAEVINNFLRSNQQVADLFNTLGEGMTHYKWCKVIHEARRGLKKYMRRKYKILWSEFVSAYFSKPWLVAGSIAAVLLLWMTMAQVLCLFINCNP